MSVNNKDVVGLNNHVKGNIISKFDLKSRFIFCLFGLHHKDLMERLGVDYILINEKISSNEIRYIQGLKDKEIYFISNNPLDFVWAWREFMQLLANCYLLDLEILNALTLIPKKERELNQCLVGISLPLSYTLGAFFEDVIKTQGYKSKEAYEVLKNLLIESIKEIKKGLENGSITSS